MSSFLSDIRNGLSFISLWLVSLFIDIKHKLRSFMNTFNSSGQLSLVISVTRRYIKFVQLKTFSDSCDFVSFLVIDLYLIYALE